MTEKRGRSKRRRKGLDGLTTAEKIAALEGFHVRAVLTQREYGIALKAGVHASWPTHDGQTRGDFRPGFIASQAWFQLWVASLYVVVEGWGQLGIGDDSVDTLLSLEPAHLHEEFRHSAFHFNPRYATVRFNYTGPEGLEWTEDLTAAFSSYFVSVLGGESLLVRAKLVDLIPTGSRYSWRPGHA